MSNIFLSLLFAGCLVFLASARPFCDQPISSSQYTFYVTLHATPELSQYNAKGNLISKSPHMGKNVQLRGMALTENGGLIIGNGAKERSVMFEATKCGQGTYFELTGTDLSHPYGIAFGKNPQLAKHRDLPETSTILYVSNQNSNQITYHILQRNNVTVYLSGTGTFGTPSTPFTHLRDIAVDPATQYVYAADTENGLISVFDQAGTEIKTIEVISALNLHIGKSAGSDRNLLYVSSISDENPAVYAYDLLTWELMKSYTTPTKNDMAHPCGIALCGDDLLVLSQDNNSLLRFSQNSTEYLGLVIPRDGFPDHPEDIFILNCYD